jgi:outer membrane receptor protein involved in Fe transport
MTSFKRKPLVQAISAAITLKTWRRAHGASLVGAGLLAQGLLVGSAWSQGAVAQVSPAAPKAAADASSPPTETVMVTARKKLERAQDVPVSMSAVNADTLLTKNRLSMTEYFSEVPGINILGGDRGTNEVSLRGLTSGTASRPTTAFTIDDTPFGGGQNIPDLDPGELQRIEVLRGPQGTLYGANSLGGLIKYVTVAPDPQRFSARVQVDGAQVNHGTMGFGLRTAVNLPVKSEVLGLRLSAFSRRDPGFINDVRSGETGINTADVTGARLAMLVTPSSTLSVRASLMHQNTDAKASPTINTDRTGKPLFGPFEQNRIPDTDGYQRNITFSDLNIGKDFEWGRLTSVTSFSRLGFVAAQDATATLQGALNGIFPGRGYGGRNDQDNQSEQITQELRIESPEDGQRNLDWRVGLFYSHQNNEALQRLYAVVPSTGAAAAGPTLANVKGSSKATESAVFGTATYRFSRPLDVQVGVRSNRNASNTTTVSNGIIVSNSTTVVDSSTTATTYLLTPRYTFSSDLMVYATLATGFRPGGPTNAATPGAPASYAPDKSRNLELGLKGDFFNRSLSVAAALYRIDWSDIQLNARATTGISFIANGGQAKSDGAEISFTWVPQSGLKITGNAVYSNAVLTENFLAAVTTVGVKGDRLPFSAKSTANLSFTRDLTFNGLNAYAGAGVSMVGKRLGDFETRNVARIPLDSYSTVDLQAGVRMRNVTLNLFGKNVTDKTGYIGSRITGASQRMVLITPRTVGITMSATF